MYFPRISVRIYRFEYIGISYVFWGAEWNGKGFGMIEGQGHVLFYQGQSSKTHYIHIFHHI